MKKQCGIIVALYAVGNPVFVYAQETLGERPNFVWFMAEDVYRVSQGHCCPLLP